MNIHLIPPAMRYTLCGGVSRRADVLAVQTQAEFNALPRAKRCLRCDAIINGVISCLRCALAEIRRERTPEEREQDRLDNLTW